MQPFKRRIKIVLTSRELKKKISFGDEFIEGKDSLNISVNAFKYMSPLKDTCTIKISNLTPSEVTQIIYGKFFDVEVFCGYENTGINKIFDGGIYHISNQFNDLKTKTVILFCTSKLVATFAQKRLNLTINSGTNMYYMIKYLGKKAGMSGTNEFVSTQLKKIIVDSSKPINNSFPEWLNKECEKNQNLIVNSDNIDSSSFSVYDASKSNQRIIPLTKDNMQLTGGYPTLTSEGLDLTVFPIFNFKCGDVIKIDNSLLDIHATSMSEANKMYAAYFNNQGEYMIFTMQYVLQNRGSSFSLQIKCKNRGLISQYMGKQ